MSVDQKHSNWSTTGSTIGKITCGDLIVHPTKSWPWIGTVQPKVGDFARLCTNCGGLRVPSSVGKDINTQYKIRIESEEGPVPLCESEHEDSPSIIDAAMAGMNGRCFGDCMEDDDDRISNDAFVCPPLPKLALPVIPPGVNHLQNDIIPPPLVALSVEGALPGRHFQVHWFPSGDLTDMDGKEKVIVPFKQRSLFQEGSPVVREGALNDQGLVKQVHRKVDAFVLGDHAWVIKDLSASKLKPLMDIEQCPGCFVIYKGWVGTVYSVWYRITFRMEDGTEFILTDDQGEIGIHMREENRKTPCADIYQMYPGLKVKVRWMLLENAKWSNGYEPAEEIQEKIKKSRDAWNASETADPVPIIASGFRPGPPFQVQRFDEATPSTALNNDYEASGGKKPGKYSIYDEQQMADFEEILDNAMAESAHKMDIHIPMAAAKREFAAAAAVMAAAPWGPHMRSVRCETSAEDMVTLTVVKLEPMKLDVEWLSQVVADVPAGPKGNVIEGDELKSMHVFRSSRIFEPFDLGVRYRYVVEPNDQIIPADVWRQSLLEAGEKKEKSEEEIIADLPPPPSPGDLIYLAIAKSSSKIDILWENGQFETGVEPEILLAQYSNQTERDYFPAMYVTFQTDSSTNKNHNTKNHYHRGKSDSGMMDDASQTTRTSSDTAIDGFMASHETPSASSNHNNWLPNKFGVVKKAKNSEKYATVAWYEMKKKHGDNHNNNYTEIEEPIFINEEDVSFYDLKFYYEFNYVGGTLVSRIDATSVPPGIPNVGYVMRKNPDASVQVVWFDGKEEMTKPWKLRQLTARYDSEYTPSEAGDEQHYYSPTEHEYEDLEDFRYYDYSTLTAEARQKRIGLIVAVLREVILRLCSLTLTLDNFFPYIDRKKIMKLTLSCNDVCNGFANLAEFRETVKEMFENEQQLAMATANEKTNDGNGPKSKLFKGRFVREERLVWQCANWLYDWTEAMTTLQEDMRKYRNKIQRKEQIAQDSTTSSADIATATANDSMTTMPNKEDTNGNIKLATVLDLQNEIEAGLSTVTGILSVPPGSDVAGGIVADYLSSLSQVGRLFHYVKNDIHPSEGTSYRLAKMSCFASFNSCHKFLRTLVENPSKVGRLPCFSYTHHSELELSALYKQWPTSQFVENTENFVLDDDYETIHPITCQNVVEGIGQLIEDVLHGRRDISYTDDNVLKLCNETADALCLSVLSIMIRIIEAIYVKLLPQIDIALEETKNDKISIDENLGGNESLSTNEDEEIDLDETQSITENAQIPNLDKQEKMVNGEIKERTGLNGLVPSMSFELQATSPASHRFASKQFDPTIMPKSFLSAARREIKLLHSSLPPGIFVKTYEDRMDLFSCMIIGPQGTPYADGVFFFDVRLKDDYPSRPPHLFYKSMSKLLNPNLYEDGMVCLSLLGTWDGKETELWTSNSTLLQVFVSIQSLILVSEPYFNEPGFEKEKGSQSGATKSRDYNEAAVLRTLESLQRALNDPPEPFYNEMRQHIVENSQRLLRLLEKYQDPQGDNEELSFPLFPVTQGFCLCIKRHAENLRRLTEKWSAATD